MINDEIIPNQIVTIFLKKFFNQLEILSYDTKEWVGKIKKLKIDVKELQSLDDIIKLSELLD